MCWNYEKVDEQTNEAITAEWRLQLRIGELLEIFKRQTKWMG